MSEGDSSPAGTPSLGAFKASLQLAGDRCGRVLALAETMGELISGVRAAIEWTDPEAVSDSVQAIETHAALAHASLVEVRNRMRAARDAARSIVIG